MGECLIVRRGGESYELPTLDASYPKDATVTAAANGSASFFVSIKTPGRPAEYTYQWYRNGAVVPGAVTDSFTVTGLTSAGSYSIYCKVTNKAGSVNSRVATLTVLSYLPAYTYSGLSNLIDDGGYNWRLKLLTSGTLTFSHLGSAGSKAVDLFLVGGGGGAGGDQWANYVGGGGGGYVKSISSYVANRQTPYQIVIGAGGERGTNGGSTTAFGQTAQGGFCGGGTAGPGGDGGSGGGGGGCPDGVNGYPRSGNGGSNGSNGLSGSGSSRVGAGGNGSGVSTREFGDPSGTLYSSGGAGEGANSNYAKNGEGISGANSGCGASIEPNSERTAGSGIVIIRNHRG